MLQTENILNISNDAAVIETPFTAANTFSQPPGRPGVAQSVFQPMLASDLADWLRLEQTEGVGSSTARRLMAAFGLPANIFSSSLTALQNVVSHKIALVQTLQLWRYFL